MTNLFTCIFIYFFHIFVFLCCHVFLQHRCNSKQKNRSWVVSSSTSFVGETRSGYLFSSSSQFSVINSFIYVFICFVAFYNSFILCILCKYHDFQVLGEKSCWILSSGHRKFRLVYQYLLSNEEKQILPHLFVMLCYWSRVLEAQHEFYMLPVEMTQKRIWKGYKIESISFRKIALMACLIDLKVVVWPNFGKSPMLVQS